MSLGKENGREKMMRDAFGRVRLEDHVARPKKKAARAGGSVRRTRAAWNRPARGPKSGQAKEDTRDCDDRAWFKIAISSRISRIASSRISIRARASRTLWTTFERREDKKSLTQTFLSFATHTTDFEGLHDRELEGAKDVLQEGECRHLLQR